MSYQQLTNDERYQIKACLQLHMNQISIAKLLNRSPATISREIRRNTGKRGIDPSKLMIKPQYVGLMPRSALS